MSSHVAVALPKVPTVSRKSERLLNLTIALLATPRWLTKSEIFSSVEGYEGDVQARERMFERDKDELRQLGISIEVGSFDPLFQDEAGYRITKESYQWKADDLDSTEIALLIMASKVWNSSVSSPISAQRKLESISQNGSDADSAEVRELPPLAHSIDPNVQIVLEALSSMNLIEFEYITKDVQSSLRQVAPYGLAVKHSLWYLVGQEVVTEKIKTYRLDRISGPITIAKNGAKVQVPEDFNLHSYLDVQPKIALIEVKAGKAHLLRNRSEISSRGDDWDQIRYPYFDEEQLVQDVLWHLNDARIIAPETAVRAAIEALDEVIALHG